MTLSICLQCSLCVYRLGHAPQHDRVTPGPGRTVSTHHRPENVGSRCGDQLHGIGRGGLDHDGMRTGASMASLHPGELLIDLGEDKAARAVVFGLLDELEKARARGRGPALADQKVLCRLCESRLQRVHEGDGSAGCGTHRVV
jgi:hypothetical protein